MQKNIFYILFFTLLIGCFQKKTPTKEEALNEYNANELSNCTANLKRGDLVLRKGKDAISQILADLNPKERRYSHCGMVEIINNKLFVYNINPESKFAIQDDTIRLEPIDSFLSAKINEEIGAYRFNLTEKEIDSTYKIFKQFQSKKARFDMKFNMADDDHLYCSELIVKSIEKATNNKTNFPRVFMDSVKVIGVRRFLKLTDEKVDLKKYPLLTMDNLYLNGKATLIFNGIYKDKNDF
jgi:hypothetical protein